MSEDAPVPHGFVVVELKDAFSAGLGPIYLHAAASKIGFRVLPRHLNPTGVCHGGALASFADMQVIAVAPRFEESGVHRPTVSLTIDYVAPVPAGAWVEAVVTLVKTTKTLLFAQALLYVGDEIVARANGIYRNYTPRQARS